MTRADIRDYLIRAAIVILVAIVFAVGAGQILFGRADRAEQEELRAKLSFFLPADRYEAADPGVFAAHSSIRAFYLARDSSGKLLGYIIDIRSDDREEGIYVRMSVTPEGEKIIRIRPINENGTFQDDQDSEVLNLCSQIEGVRIPIALHSQMAVEILTQNEYPSIPGLHDGVFYAEAEDYDRSFYKDFIEIKVSDGRIVSVLWDAKHRDEVEPNRAQASVTGAFSLGENQPIWVAQAYAIQKKLVEVQDPDKLAVKSDGTTEIVDGVVMDVNMFYELSVRCIDNSKSNIPRPTATPSPTPGPSATPARAKPTVTPPPGPSPSDTGVNGETSIPTLTPSPSPSPTPTVTPTPVPNPDFDDSVIGNEDGVVEPGRNPILTDNIDGLPFSEIRTQIEGLEKDPDLSKQMTRSVNLAYAFLREYLKWGA